jgi:mannose-6-phosphate isomerase
VTESEKFEPFYRIRQWLIGAALPKWGSVGFDSTFGGFRERLDLQGRPIADVPYRLLTQARQIYAFSHAFLLGWAPEGRDLAGSAVDNLRRRYESPDGSPGYVFSVSPTSGAVDPRRDFYGHAFVLFALAWWYRVSADARCVDTALRLMETMDRIFGAASGGGYVDGHPYPQGQRIQNPHMHYFEAMVAWHQATGEARFLARAGEIFGLFCGRFWQPRTKSLPEYFDQDWTPVDGDAGAFFEPGHHFEWSWLLRAYGRMAGRSVEPYAHQLYETAERQGFLEDGRIADQVLPGRGVHKGSTRLWPHTEWAKASAAEFESGNEHAGAAALKALALLQARFCRPELSGGWIDHLDGEGRPIVEFMPATSLYHILLAVAEVGRVFDLPPA